MDNYFIHPSSYVDENCTIGEGTKIWHFSHILKNCIIGKNCTIGQNVMIGPDVTIGNGVKIQNNVSIYNGVTCEDKVFIGPSVVFTNVKTPRAHVDRSKKFSPTVIRHGASIGANATIVCGTEIGSYAFIGAGSVVTKNISSYALVVGNPSNQKGWACECGVLLKRNPEGAIQCSDCSIQYEEKDKQLKRLN